MGVSVLAGRGVGVLGDRGPKRGFFGSSRFAVVRARSKICNFKKVSSK